MTVAGGLFRQEEVLRKANLRPTILLELMRALEDQGTHFSGEIRKTSDFIEALLARFPKGGAHGS